MNFATRAYQLCGQAALLVGWRPEEFWRATPLELQSVVAAMLPDRSADIGREELNAMMARFPDGRAQP